MGGSILFLQTPFLSFFNPKTLLQRILLIEEEHFRFLFRVYQVAFNSFTRATSKKN